MARAEDQRKLTRRVAHVALQGDLCTGPSISNAFYGRWPSAPDGDRVGHHVIMFDVAPDEAVRAICSARLLKCYRANQDARPTFTLVTKSWYVDIAAHES